MDFDEVSGTCKVHRSLLENIKETEKWATDICEGDGKAVERQ